MEEWRNEMEPLLAPFRKLLGIIGWVLLFVVVVLIIRAFGTVHSAHWVHAFFVTYVGGFFTFVVDVFHTL